MKNYTITLTEDDVARIMVALSERENRFRLKAIEAITRDVEEVSNNIANEYNRLFEKFNAL